MACIGVLHNLDAIDPAKELEGVKTSQSSGMTLCLLLMSSQSLAAGIDAQSISRDAFAVDDAEGR